MKTILYDYIDGVLIPVRRVDLIESFTRIQEPLDRNVGLWRMKSGDFFVCKSHYAGNNEFDYSAEIISQSEAKFIAPKNPEIYARLFIDLPDIECENIEPAGGSPSPSPSSRS